MSEPENISQETEEQMDAEKHSVSVTSIIILIIIVVLLAVVAILTMRGGGSALVVNPYLTIGAEAENGVIMVPDQKPSTTPIVDESEEDIQARITTVDDRVLKVMEAEDVGWYLADANNGMTLYVMYEDGECDPDCQTEMTPYLSYEEYFPLNSGAESLLGSESVTDRGIHQFTWRGKKLYHYVEDEYSGAITGDGVRGEFTIAKP